RDIVAILIQIIISLQCITALSSSRIALIKDISIPKLELLSILIGVRAGRFVLDQLSCHGKYVTVWSDAKSALFWVKNESKALPRFVQRRVEEIRNSHFKLRYIASHDNPADVATRGISPTKLRYNKLWWNGPYWLDKDQSLWPNCEFSYNAKDEVMQARTVLVHGIRSSEPPFGLFDLLKDLVKETYLG
ncbi:unnamed protein product, partial [Acanthocheilonema viteae]